MEGRGGGKSGGMSGFGCDLVGRGGGGAGLDSSGSSYSSSCIGSTGEGSTEKKLRYCYIKKRNQTNQIKHIYD